MTAISPFKLAEDGTCPPGYQGMDSKGDKLMSEGGLPHDL